MDIIRAIEQQQINPEVADFNVGDNVKVHYRIKEGNRERIQVFQGDVIRRHGASSRETFTVRKISFSVGVERTFPVHSPKIEKIEVTRRGDVNRATFVTRLVRLPRSRKRLLTSSFKTRLWRVFFYPNGQLKRSQGKRNAIRPYFYCSPVFSCAYGDGVEWGAV